MFCFQCQETAKNSGCTVKGMCGKPEETANLHDLLIFVLRGIAVYGERLKELGQPNRSNDDFVLYSLFATITNANWDDARFTALIQEGLARRDKLRSAFLAAYKAKNGKDFSEPLPEAATWTAPAGNPLNWGTLYRFSLVTNVAPDPAFTRPIVLGMQGADGPAAYEVSIMVPNTFGLFDDGFEN